ncbi:hypothetical protein ACFVQ4_25085 [Streptomyces laurentii]|uniref:hypothetical protein n=1 Tax=Streptomyces laurentii TaxID=39478 RepID=UPI0036BAD5FC
MTTRIPFGNLTPADLDQLYEAFETARYDAERLRAREHRFRTRALKAEAAVDHLTDKYRGAEAAVERVRALHQPVTSPYDGRTICTDCSGYGTGSCDAPPQPYPCPTIRALEPQEPRPGAGA